MKNRVIDACIVLQDAIVVAALTDYPTNEIKNTLEYIMQKANIKKEDLQLYSLRHNLADDINEMKTDTGEPYFSPDWVNNKIL